MKKKIFTLMLCIALAAIVVVGGSMAYFTDTDAQENVFTIGEIKIDLFEDFNTDQLRLIPAVPYIDQATGVTQYKNKIEKEVYVENTGANKAYVRVQVATPNFQKDGQNINVISLQFDDMTIVDGKWIWGTDVDTNYPPHVANGEWNMYRDITINGIPYKVYVITYETALDTGDITPDAFDSVMMDPAITQEDIAGWNTAYGEGEWAKVYVVAEAVQADGFDDAITALNTAFGVPGTDYVPDFGAASEGQTIVERVSNDGN